MNNSEYLKYSATEPMTELRRRFNDGESIYKDVPVELSIDNARADVLYVQYVFENAYSGYSYYDETLFRTAFISVLDELETLERITPNELIDLMCKHLCFISDGHLSLSTQDYRKGFYKKTQTYVTDLILSEIDGCYFDLHTDKPVSFDNTLRVFPTITKNGTDAYLLGVRSKEQIEAISVKIGNVEEILPVHKIKSHTTTDKCLVKECYLGDTAIIACSSFVGDSEEQKNRLYEIGKKCRNYKHVVWDLSNNLGGNSELPKQFLLGLTGGFRDTLKFLELRSTLVHAKEYGNIQDISRHFEQICNEQTERADLFNGELHVIVNDMVASSAEIAVAWAKTLHDVTFYGCNSLGIGRFGELCIYYLPNSKITLWCPQKVFDTNIVETVGFEPDYWIDSTNVVGFVQNKIISTVR